MQPHLTDRKTKVQKGEVSGELTKELKVDSKSPMHLPLSSVLDIASCQQIFNKQMK